MSGDKGNKRGGDDRDRPGNKKSKVRLNPPNFPLEHSLTHPRATAGAKVDTASPALNPDSKAFSQPATAHEKAKRSASSPSTLKK